jgi:hypothetical protein
MTGFDMDCPREEFPAGGDVRATSYRAWFVLAGIKRPNKETKKEAVQRTGLLQNRNFTCASTSDFSVPTAAISASA